MYKYDAHCIWIADAFAPFFPIFKEILLQQCGLKKVSSAFHHPYVFECCFSNYSGNCFPSYVNTFSQLKKKGGGGGAGDDQMSTTSQLHKAAHLNERCFFKPDLQRL